ncbi:Increased DNA methylation 1 [Nymphaea thermarum]|nr:Increased DNA methylation 1 [Nymphaea thermarum]
MLLEKGDELISVAVIRIHGEKVAEMPLVGTRVQYQRQGMCHLLMSELENMLSALGVERLILPAASQLKDTWIRSFGFMQLTSEEKFQLLGFTFLDFQDTIMCQKLLSPIIRKNPQGRGD